MSQEKEILEWFNYDAIFDQNKNPLTQTNSKYQNDLDDPIKALIPDILKGDLMSMFKFGEMLSYHSNDASLWLKSEKHRECKYNAWILMGLGFKQLYPSYQKEILTIHYPGRIADLINIDGIANIDILNQVRHEAKKILFKQ